MIYRMDQIYSDASLTIIDASGGDPQRGLPGVSTLARRPQRCVHIGNTALLELPCGAYEVKSSKWATRGWTYQEGFFSPRRLIFTPSQVLFLCNKVYREESVCRLLQQDDPEEVIGPATFDYLIPWDTEERKAAREVRFHLEEYSRRELTYARDSLNACLGILNYLTHESRSLEELQPTLHISWGLLARTDRDTGDLRVYLDWYHEAPAERRSGFPSWAWTGWEGPVRFEYEGITLRKDANAPRSLSHLEWEISWASKGVTIWEFANDAGRTSYTDKLQVYQQPTYPRRLKITCSVVPIRFQVVPLTEAQRNQEFKVHYGHEYGCIRVKRSLPSGSVPVLQFWKGTCVTVHAYLDRDLDAQDCLIGLIFPMKGGILGWMRAGCLLARKLGGDLYERIGVMRYLFDYTQYVEGEPCVLSFPQFTVFFDGTGNVLDEVGLSAREKTLPFDAAVGERRTIFLE